MDKERYKDVDTQSVSDAPEFQPVVRHRSLFRLLLFGCIGSFVLATFLVTVVRYPWTAADSEYYAFTSCGNTPEEARAAGCGYEPMGRYWVPPECYFPESDELYSPFRDREWFLDTNLTIPANVSRLESGDARRAYTRYWHDEHCSYMLRKLALAFALKKRMVNHLLADVEHANHCAFTIERTINNAYNESFLANDQSITESILDFQICVPLSSFSIKPGEELKKSDD